MTASTMFNKKIPVTDEEKEEAEANWPASPYIAKQDRLAGKKSNFTIIYGSGNDTLLEFFVWILPNATAEDMGRFREAYFKTYPGAAKYVKNAFKLFNEGQPQPRTLWMPDGKKITVTNTFMSPAITLLGRKIQVARPNQYLSFPIQGSAADAFKLAVCHMRYRAEQEGVKLECCNQVHDDLIARTTLRHFNRAAQLFRDGMEWSINFICKRLFYTPVEQDFLILSCCGTTFGEYDGNGHSWAKWDRDLNNILHHQETRIADNEYLKDLVLYRDDIENSEAVEKYVNPDAKDDIDTNQEDDSE